MQPSHFYRTEEDPAWEMSGADPWSRDRFREIFDVELVNQLRQGPVEGIDDLEAAYALTQLAQAEFEQYGAGGGNKLDDDEGSALLRCLRTLLKRLGIDFTPPFRHFTGFRGYWGAEGMSGSWTARRGYVNELFTPILEKLEALEDERTQLTSIKGVDGQLKNLIFASTGPKPEIVLRDAINNVVEVTRNSEYCLFYDQPLNEAGLTWGTLVDWWRAKNRFGGTDETTVAHDLYARLSKSLGENPVERLLFRTYCERYAGEKARSIPALIPQVYLHYDPLTHKQRGNRPGVLPRERMDFLLLLPHGVRVVLEVDGKQHYAKGDKASPELYSEMVAEDRRLRLRSYEVYRFGGHELGTETAADMLRKFFDDLLARHT